MRKKISDLVRLLFETNRERQHRGIIVLIGDRAKDQVINLYNLWLTIRNKNVEGKNIAQPKILWCYKTELGFSSHQQKRRKELNKRMKQGLYESESENPFELFLTSSDIRFCYYKDTLSILGSTYEALVFQDFESLTANILCRTIETVAGGGVVFFMLKSMQSLKQLYMMSMDVHNRYRTDAFRDIQPHFNERMMLSLVISEAVIFMDDELNVIQQLQAKEKTIGLDDGQNDSLVANLRGAEQNRLDLIKSLESNKVIHSILSLTKTIDQAKVVLFLLDSTINKNLKTKSQPLSSLLHQTQKMEAVFLSAGRGRGKSAALGLAIAGSLACNCGRICITAATPENIKTVFEFVIIGLEALGYKKNNDFSVQFDDLGNPKRVIFLFISESVDHSDLDTKNVHFSKQSVEYVHPEEKISNADLLVIDEAAAIPLVHVRNLVASTNCPVFISSTIHGYEGSGRSLSIKLIEELRNNHGKNSGRQLREIEMTIPIRYALLDPIENWLHSFLCLDSTTAVPLKNPLPHPKDCQLFFINKTTLFSYHKSSEHFLKNLWSLFVSSHYKNSPNDLQLLADAPSHALCVLLGPIDKTKEKTGMPDILVAIQICFEGGVKKTTIENNEQRGIKPSGDLVPWTLSDQFLDRSLFDLMGSRIIRIASHPAAARMGYGSRSIDILRQFFKNELIQVDHKISWEAFVNPQVNSMDNDALTAQIVPKKQLPSLLKNACELNPPDIQYLSVSYGLTKDLFKFWDKNQFRCVHIKHSKNEITGENNAIMLCEVRENSLNYAFFNQEFKHRFVSLLSCDFRNLELFIALQILKPNLSTAESIDVDCQSDGNAQLITTIFSTFDVARLEAYSRNSVEYYMIKDLVQKLSELFFLNEFGPDVRLSLSQAAILLGFGLQKRSVEELIEILQIEHSQILALYNKSIKKFTLQIKAYFDEKEAQTIGLKREIKDENSHIFEPLKNDPNEIIGTVKSKFTAFQKKQSKRVKQV